MQTLWSQLVGAYLRFAERRALLVLAVAVGLAGVGLWAAQRIAVNPRLEALLPEDSPALPAIEEMQERVPSSSPYYLLVSSEDPDLNHRLARRLKEEVSEWPETRYALDRRDPSFFLARKLLFLPAADLKELAYQVEDIVDFEECQAVPGCVNLDKRPPDPDEAALRKQIESEPEVRALLALFGLEQLPEEGGTTAPAPPKSPAAAANTGTPSPANDTTLGSLCNEDSTVCAVTVFLNGSPSNLDYAEHIVRKTDALFAAVRPADAPPSLQLESSGPYRNATLTKDTVAKDLGLTASLSTGLMVLLVLVQFRGFRSFLLIFGPLVFAALWTVGIIAFIHPELNIISAFTLAVLAGLGIDFGVHMLTHYGSARGEQLDPSAALRSTYDKLGGPMAMACITSGCGFGALIAADFRGFAEMGGLAALGVGCALLAFFLSFPALVHVCHQLVPEKKALVRTLRFPLPSMRRPARIARRVVIAGALLALGAGVLGSQVSFEYNFRNLRPEKVSHGISWKSAMHGTSRSAVVMLADSAESLEQTAESLRTAYPERAADEQTWLLTPASFVPKNQEARLAAIGELRSAVERAKARLSEKELARLGHLEPLLAIDKPITPEGLPQWVREWLTDKDGTFGTFGLMYNDLRGSDARAMEQLAIRLAAYREQFPDVRFASAEALLGLIIPGLRHDAPTMVLLALAGLFVGTLLIGRSLPRTLTILLPLVLATCCTLGLMVAFDLRVNLYNMLVFPLSFGIGIDGAVYVVWSMSRYDPEHTPAELSLAARAVLGSTLTTAAGFGSMMVASNPGLASLGLLAVLALLSSLVCNLIWLPAFMYLRKGPPDAPDSALYANQTSEARAL